MLTFLEDFSRNPFLITGLIAGLLASIACGTVGPWVVTRRIAFLAGAIAHMAVGGIGLVIFLQRTWPETFAGLSPTLGALGAAMLGAAVIGVVHERAHERLDTLIGAMWAVGMSLGLMLVKFTDGYEGDLMTWLFGNIGIVAWSQVALLAVLNAVIVTALVLSHRRLLAICLDPQHARLQGVPVARYNMLLLQLTAITVVALMQVVGLILVIALLTLPAATAGRFTQRLRPMMIASVIIAGLCTTLPRMAVYGTRVSPEAAIVLAAAGVYLVALLIPRGRRAG